MVTLNKALKIQFKKIGDSSFFYKPLKKSLGEFIISNAKDVKDAGQLILKNSLLNWDNVRTKDGATVNFTQKEIEYLPPRIAAQLIELAAFEVQEQLTEVIKYYKEVPDAR